MWDRRHVQTAPITLHWEGRHQATCFASRQGGDEARAAALEASWAVTNLAALEHDVVEAVAPTAPLLVAHLNRASGYAVSEQCAWALGEYSVLVFGILRWVQPGAVDELLVGDDRKHGWRLQRAGSSGGSQWRSATPGKAALVRSRGLPVRVSGDLSRAHCSLGPVKPTLGPPHAGKRYTAVFGGPCPVQGASLCCHLKGVLFGRVEPS